MSPLLVILISVVVFFVLMFLLFYGSIKDADKSTHSTDSGLGVTGTTSDSDSCDAPSFDCSFD